MKKRILAILLTVCMVVSMVPAALAEGGAVASVTSGRTTGGTTTNYTTLKAAFEAVGNGGTVTLLADLTIDSETYTIADDVSITLDMNGKKLTVTDNKESGNYELFYIYGGMTVIGDGTIELTATYDRDWNAMSAIFHNRGGVLAIVNGTFTHLGGADMAYVVDNSGNWYGDATTTIKDGTLSSTYIAIRNRMEQNSHGYSGTAYLNVEGGTISGTSRAIWAQAASTSTTSPATGAINISGGTVGLIDTARSDGAECMTTISGGTVAAFKGEVGELTVTSTGTAPATITMMTAGNVETEYVVTNGVYAQAVAKVGETKYTTLQAAFDAVADGETITVITDITFTTANVGYNANGWVDGVKYTGDKSFTVDFGGYTVTDDSCINDYLIYMTNLGEKANEITFKNGTLVAKNGCWATVCVNSNSSTYATVLNLNGINIINSNDASYNGNLAVRARNMATVNVNAGTVITSDGASYGVAAETNGIVNINSGATVIQKNSGTSSGNSVFTAVGGNGTVNIYDGAIITSDNYGVHTMTTGKPVINIYGGTITAANALHASTNGAADQSATINVYGGTITGGLTTYSNNGNIVVSGGSFSSDPAAYCAAGYTDYKNANGMYGIIEATEEEISASASVTFNVAPSGATIIIKSGDTVIGTSAGTYNLPGGTYTYTVSKSGYITKTGSFTADGEDLDVEVSLSVYVVPTFVDVASDVYYYDAVLWAAKNEITNGTSATTFSPDMACTRAQAVTFLWRTAGSPEPVSTIMPFEDVSADDYYYKAVLWAMENGITSGTSATTFSPDMACTRAQAVTFLWRAAGSPEPISTIMPFEDVSADDYYYKAVLWAMENGITNGTSAATFSSDADCARAQIVTLLYRCMGDK